MKPYLVIVIFIVSLIACKKDCNTNITLTFLDENTSQPVADYKVLLTKLPFFTFDGAPGGIDTLTTDANGNISYSFKSGDNEYYIEPIRNKSYSGFKYFALTSCTNNTQRIKLIKFSAFKMNLIDSSGIYKQYTLSFNEDLSYVALQRGNCKDTTIIFTNAVPDGRAIIMFDLYKGLIDSSNLVAKGIDSSVYILKVDTTEFTLKY